MDVEPPFFQKETDSSNEEQREPLRDADYPFGPGARQVSHLRTAVTTHSSSADDYRSVIDDLTVENKRLKEELKRYKQFGPDMMRREKLFEIKVHGLPKRKKRELEATLREFAANLEGSSESPPQRNKMGRHGKNTHSSGESMSKHASSSSSRSRPVDSAYASMSTGPSSRAPHSSKASLSRPSIGSRARISEQKVEDYLRDTPDGLFPRHVTMTDKERKKLVVRRLEQLFTGKKGKNGAQLTQPIPSGDMKSASDTALVMAPPRNLEAAREARIQPNDPSRKKPRSRDNASTSNSNGDQTESGGNGRGSGDGGGSGGRTVNNTSPPTVLPPEQRPTRPKDLDPDRVQVPSENMDYIRHLGLVPGEFPIARKSSGEDVCPDEDGWVYLNLLCNLAQLHIFNVTPSFIRLAVTEKSAKFQLSPDGRKIRWRGGRDGTKFSSESSGDNSQKSPSADDTDGSNGGGQRKRLKSQATGDVMTSVTSSKKSKLGPQVSASSGSFHYKPMFVRQSSSMETSLEGTGSQASDGAPEESGNSKWDYSGSGSSPRKRRRNDGAIVYYSGAPFCIDLSGDAGDVSPTTYLTSTAQEPDSMEDPTRLAVHRTLSGSSLPIRPLSDPHAIVSGAMDMDVDNSSDLLEDDEGTLDDERMEFPWCDNPQEAQLHPIEPPFEACGLGGVLPEDHFAVIVTTRRQIRCVNVDLHPAAYRSQSEELAEAVAGRLASMSTSSPIPPRHRASLDNPIEMEYLTGKIRRMRPVRLPPPATFFPPFSSDSDSNDEDDEMDSEDGDISGEDSVSEALISQRANPHLSDNTDNTDDDNDELPSNSQMIVVPGVTGDDRMSEASDSDKPLRPEMVASAGTGQRPGLLHTGSSVATAGGAESGYNSSMEDDAQ